MKKLLLTGIFAAGALYLPMAMADDGKMSMDAAKATTYVKDSVITTKVKAKLAAKHLATLTDIKVDTDKAGAVYLSGRAPTKDASDLAAMLAKDTDGVTSVHNKIIVAE